MALTAAQTSMRLDTKRFQWAIKRLGDKAHVAIVRSLKRGATTAQTTMARAVNQDMGLAVAAAKKAIAIRQGRVETEHVIVLEVEGSKIPLIDFKATGPGGASKANPVPSGGKGRGVSYKIGSLGRTRVREAFIARVYGKGGGGGHVGVFRRRLPSERKGKSGWSKNLPIIELHGPSIAKVFAKHRKAGATAGLQSVQKNLQHELRYALQQRAQAEQA